MKTSRFKYLYQQYLSDRLTAAERLEWMNLLADKPMQEEFEQDIPWFDIPVDDLVGMPQDKVDPMIAAIVSYPQRELVKPKLWPWLVVAASIVLVMGFGSYFFLNKYMPLKHDANLAADIAPGKLGATLTLASGKQIHLSDALNGKLADESGVAISKTEDGQIVYELKRAAGDGSGKMNSLSTAKGETYQLRLPDGSMVWLNAASSLTYAADLNGQGKRRVSLEGEAYFEISKDKVRPFVVESRGQEVEVLGTHFNINAYQDEGMVRTTLLEGRVRVCQGNAQQVLLPGTQASNASGRLSVEQVDTDLIVAWKNNNFIFDSQRIEAIMRMIGRWYNVDVVYVGAPPKDTFWGSVSRFDKVSKVLSALESTGQVHFRLQGKTIYVSR